MVRWKPLPLASRMIGPGLPPWILSRRRSSVPSAPSRFEVEEAEHEVVVRQCRQRLVNRAGEDRLVAPCGQEAPEMALHDGIGLHHEHQALLQGSIGKGCLLKQLATVTV